MRFQKSARILALILLTASQAFAEPWKPPEPDPDDFDWVQLDSGEWLKGRIIGMQDETLVFDSEELDTLELDMDDVIVVRSPRTISTRVGDKEFVEGTLLLTKDEIIIGGESSVNYPRSRLLAFVPDATRKIDAWKGKFSLGSTVRRGNVDQADFNARAELVRRDAKSRFNFNYLGTYSKIDGVESTNNQRIDSQLDLFFSDRFFARAPFVEYLSDPFQNIQSRTTVGAALGYDTIASKDVEWNLTLGPAYQHTKFNTVEAGEDPSQNSAALVFTSDYSWDMTSNLTFGLDYSGQFTSKEAGDTTHHSEMRLEIDLTSKLDLDFSLIWDRTENPVADETGVVPDKNDYRLISAIGFDF